MGDYQVSEKIRERFDTLIGMEEVQKALKFIENDVPRSIEEQKALKGRRDYRRGYHPRYWRHQHTEAL